MLSCKNIEKKYANSNGKISRVVLNNLDLSIASGEKIAIIGPSGSGKTTLLNIIGSMDIPDNGEVIFKNENILNYTEQQKSAYRNLEIGFVFQQHFLLPQCTLLENVLTPSLINKETKSEAPKRAEELLKKLGIWELRSQKPGELSGGECQRGALARALINKPSIIIADEPTGSLDNYNAEILAKYLLEINEEEKTALVMATHSMKLASDMDKIFKLENGSLQLVTNL
ncbi:ABC transporter ATP-binding protein [Bacteroidales bacterium]|nr:ABC transporter ATP-binding protein [Bacteroidales bacterium]